MRVRPVSAAAVLIVPLLAGCLSTGPTAPSGVGPLPAVSVQAPQALVEPTDVGARVLWKGPLSPGEPFRVTFPAGVTRVDATLKAADAAGAVSLSLVNAATGRIRCQPDRTSAWFTPTRGETHCSGLAVLDPFPVTWQTGFQSLPAGSTLELLLSTEPLDGQAAGIRLDQLSVPHLQELPTEVVQVPASVDGAKLYVEVTRPDTAARVPTILVSSPYNQATRAAGVRPQNSTIADWVPRGYAVVNADVRGFANSEGCVDVWGAKEQQDQYDLVEWIAAQPWSDGRVGFYGQSYVGTTPVEAASLAPPHLTTIVTIAPVINAYEDWHFGGVPNGENTGSPFFYQFQDPSYDLLVEQDPLEAIRQVSHAYCDPTLIVRANDPRGVYDDFYRERDFKARAANVKASVFYTQGFYDTNVKSAMIPGWFDALTVPKKALFGDWVHQHPPRADQELLFHAWFDQWLQGRDTGILDAPPVEVRTNADTIRTADTWPPSDASETRLGLDLAGGRVLSEATGRGAAQYLSQPFPATHGLPADAVAPARIELQGEPLAARLYIAGVPHLGLRATLAGVENTYFYAALEDIAPDGTARLVSFGMLNAALRDGYDAYKPVTPGQPIDYRLPFLPTEYVVEAGHRLALEIRAADMNDWSGPEGLIPQGTNVDAGVPTLHASEPGLVTLDGAGSALLLPTLPAPGDVPAPASAGPAPRSA